MENGEKKLMKEIPGIKRADPEIERKIISEFEKERSESEKGLGMIFG